MSLPPPLLQLRDSAMLHFDKLLGRAPPTWTDSLWGSWGTVLSQVGFVVSLPMTVLSFLAIPFFGGTTTSLNLVFFYLTWSAFIWTHSPRVIEVYGTLAVRMLCFLLPSISFLGFDYFFPTAAATIKARGRMQLPARLGQERLLRVAAWSTFNVILGIFISVAIEMFATSLFGFRSTLRVTMAIPLPWTMATELLKAFALRGIVHYLIHRYILHASPRKSQIARWHMQWAHSNTFMFSLAAAYDHPVCYLLAHWLPSYIPAVFWRMHVLTWLAFQVIVSLESLFIYSGYSALPSAIMLPGMARRVDAHYETRGKGNYGHLGVMDLVCRSSCDRGNDIMDDLQQEADKRQVRRRAGDALDNAGEVLEERADKIRRSSDEQDSDSDDDYVPEPEPKPERKKSNGSAKVTKRKTRQS